MKNIPIGEDAEEIMMKIEMTTRQKKDAETVKRRFEELCAAERKKFPASGSLKEKETEKGVYLITNLHGVVLHVGSTPRGKAGIKGRLRSHLAGKSSFVKKYLGGDRSRLRKSCCYCYVIVKNPRIRAYLEHYAIGRLCPKHIGCGDD